MSQQRLADRYGTSRGRGLVIAAIALAVIGGLWLAWAAFIGSVPAVSARVDAFEVDSTTVTRATVSVERSDPQRGAECLVYAQAVSFERVGELPLTLAPGGSKLTTVEVEVRTFKSATTVQTESCRAVD